MKKNHTLFLLSLFTLSFVPCLRAQNNSLGDLDAKYVPPAGSIFQIDKRITSGGSVSFDYKNIIKYEASLITRGVTAVEYERHITDFFSVAGGLGVSIFPDYVLHTRLLAFESFDIITPYTNGPGLYYKLGLRYNAGTMGDGSFTELVYRVINHNYIDNDESELTYRQRSTDLLWMGGWQAALLGNATAELSLGMGFRFLSTSDIVLSSNSAGASVYTEVDVSRTHYLLVASFKLGFGL